MSDSSTGGYIAPLPDTPLVEDDALDDIFTGAIAAITGLDRTLVRPRWQPTPPTQPPVSANWCAVGITDQDPEKFPYVQHIGAGEGLDRLARSEDIRVLISFYGPQSKGYAALLRDGIGIAQNREEMRRQGVALVIVGTITAAPELVGEQWVKRYDFPIRFRRQIIRQYDVKNILSAEGTVVTDRTTQTFDTEKETL